MTPLEGFGHWYANSDSTNPTVSTLVACVSSLCIVVYSENETLDGRLAPGFGSLFIRESLISKNGGQPRAYHLSPSLYRILLISILYE